MHCEMEVVDLEGIVFDGVVRVFSSVDKDICSFMFFNYSFSFQTSLICNFQIHKSPLRTIHVFLFRIRLGGLIDLKTLLSDFGSRIAAEAKLQRSHSGSPILRKYYLENFLFHDKHISVVLKVGFYFISSLVRQYYFLASSSIVIIRFNNLFIYFLAKSDDQLERVKI